MLVVRQGVTTLDTTSRAVESLTFAGAKILGFIFNDVGKTGNSYRYKYKYKDKYGYSYKNSYSNGYSDNAAEPVKSQEGVSEET
jgi:Mrp family chromosome partitioning ATPase